MELLIISAVVSIILIGIIMYKYLEGTLIKENFYIILQAFTKEGLTDEMKNYSSAGWKPVGGVAVAFVAGGQSAYHDKYEFFQTMTRRM